MSLLVFNGGSRIANGLIKKLHNSGQFERIVCADTFPNYWTYERYFNFKDSLDVNSPTKIEESKIFQKSNLVEAFKQATHVVYCTHDHFKVAPSKLNLIKLAGELTMQNSNIQRTVFVCPSEYDHMLESENPVASAIQSENDVMNAAGSKSVLIRSDLTFGPYSQLVHNTILAKIASGQPLSMGHNQVSVFFAEKMIDKKISDFYK